MADRRVTVNVALNATGNLAQAASAAAAQAAKLNQAAKGAAAAATATTAATTAQTAGAATAARAAIPTAQFYPPTARRWTQQDTLHAGAQQRVTDAEQRLAYLRSGPGQAATMRAVQAESALAQEQDRLARVARLGTTGAALEHFAERIESVTRAAGITGAAGLATMYGGIASVSPEAGSQITNSFRMIGNEIGIATIPAAVRFTGVLQGLARTIRTVNEGTGGWAGNLAFVGATALAGVGLLGTGLNMARNAVQGLRGAGLLGEVAAPVAGQLAGQALNRARPAAAAGGGVAQAGGVAAGTSVGGGILATGAVSPLAIAAMAVAQLADSAVNIYGTVQDVRARRGPAYDPQASGFATFRQRAEQLTGWIPGFGTGMNSLNALINAFSSERNQVPTHGLGGWAMETFLGMIGQGPQAAGAPGGPQDVTERHPQMFETPIDMYDAMMMRIQGTPGPLAEQEERANQALIQALNANTAAINNGGQFAAWPQSTGENG